MIIWGQGGGAINAFLAARIWGDNRELPQGTFMGVTRGAEMQAVVLFHDYRPEAGTIEVTIAADNPRWLNRHVMAEAGAYAFGQLGCQAAVLRADADNGRVARILTALGCKRYDIPRMRGRDKAEAVFILTDENWHKFMKG